MLLAWLLANDVQDAIFERLFVLGQPVLLPGVIKDTAVKVVPLHAGVEEADASPIVGLLFELEGAAVLHEFFELRGVAATKLFKRSIDLLLFDRVVLFVLASARQTLPGERSLEKVEDYVTDRFQIITSTLFDSLMSGN